MSKSEKAKIRDSLFSFRFADLILPEGQLTDNISADVTFSQKMHLVKIMLEFSEPMTLKVSRYSDNTVTSDAFTYAIEYFNCLFDYPCFNISDWIGSIDLNMVAGQFTPYLFDVIELQYKFLSKDERKAFAKAINESFEDDSVPFCLKNGQINQRTEAEVYFDLPLEKTAKLEQGLQDLINDAIIKHRQSNLAAHRDATEKIWDALERLKTYYTDKNKKQSAEKIVNDMAGGQSDFVTLFETEFKALTDIGNNYRIRHHETNKIHIADVRHYDYFFNRCLSLIALALQYLE